MFISHKLLCGMLSFMFLGWLANGKELEFQSLYRRISKNFLKAIPQKVIENATVEGCARNCTMETEFECKSFDFDNEHVECHLHNHTYIEPLIGLQEALDVDHYRTAYEKLFNRIPNHVITMNHNRNVRGLTVEECARRCILELSFKCSGFDYERKMKNCWLTDKVVQHVDGLKKRSNTDYYERKTNGPLGRFINYGYGSLQTIEGVQTHAKIVLGVNLDACAQLCLAETAFACASFDYVFGEQSCQLSQFIAANVHGMRSDFGRRHQVMHFELIDEYLNYFYPTPYASVLNNNERTYRKVTPDTCARKCLEEKEFVCRSFDYQIQKGTCLLSHVTGSDVVGGLYAPVGVHVHYFEMKPSLDCGGILKGDRGTLASPNWPHHYSHHLNCTWSLTVPEFKIIRLEIFHLDLGWQTDDPCDADNDVLSFTEVTAQGRSLICVENFQTEVVTATNQVNVSFTTNAENDAQGFRIFFSADWPCQTTLTSDNGEFASPRWPNTYPSLSNCQWVIQGPPLSKIVLRLNSVELEDHTGSTCKTAYDKVDVYDGAAADNNHLKTFCGRDRSFTFTSTGDALYVTFVSDSRVQGKGFHASYRFIHHTTTTTSTSTTTTTTTTTIPISTKNISPEPQLSNAHAHIKLVSNTTTNSAISNLSVSINMAMTGNSNSEDTEPLIATFVEPEVVDPDIRDDDSNDTEVRIGKTGDDIGMGARPDVAYDIIQSDKTYSAIIWGVTIAFLLMFLVMTATLLFVCRYYRRRLPKMRQGTNIENLDENLSLCHKNGLLTDHDAEFPDEADISDAARLPLPGDHEAIPDVEFHNPLFIERQTVNTDNESSTTIVVTMTTTHVDDERSDTMSNLEPNSESHLLGDDAFDSDSSEGSDHMTGSRTSENNQIDCFTTV